MLSLLSTSAEWRIRQAALYPTFPRREQFWSMFIRHVFHQFVCLTILDQVEKKDRVPNTLSGVRCSQIYGRWAKNWWKFYQGNSVWRWKSAGWFVQENYRYILLITSRNIWPSCIILPVRDRFYKHSSTGSRAYPRFAQSDRVADL